MDPAAILDNFTLRQLVEALRLASPGQTKPPRDETVALFRALIAFGFAATLEDRQVSPLSGTGAGHGYRVCVGWKGELLNVAGETFEQMVDGRYPNWENVYHSRILFYDQISVKNLNTPEAGVRATVLVSDRINQLLAVFAEAAELDEATPQSATRPPARL